MGFSWKLIALALHTLVIHASPHLLPMEKEEEVGGQESNNDSAPTVTKKHMREVILEEWCQKRRAFMCPCSSPRGGGDVPSWIRSFYNFVTGTLAYFSIRRDWNKACNQDLCPCGW